MKYIVMMTHNFDAETYTVGFDEFDYGEKAEEIAQEFLRWSWENYYNNEVEAGSHLNDAGCYHEDDYAKVEWDDGDYTEFILDYVIDRDEEFDKYLKEKGMIK